MVRRVRVPQALKMIAQQDDWAEFLRSPMPVAPKKNNKKKQKNKAKNR